jgi:hypothetical protein
MIFLKRHFVWIALLAIVAAACFYRPLAGNPTSDRWFEVETSNDTKLKRTVRVMGGAPLAQTETTPLSQGASIDIDMDTRLWQLMLVPNNRKLYKQRQASVLVSLDGGPPFAAMLSLRGLGSLRDPKRPPFDIRLSRSVAFDTGVKLRRIFLMNMRWDRSELNLEFAARLLRELGLFASHSQYVRVRVNGQPLGIMYLLEPAENAIRRMHDNVITIHRRRNFNSYTMQWSAPVADAGAPMRRLTSFAASGQLADPQADLGDVLDLDMYFRWLIVNSLLMNNDTRDDMYLYERRADAARPGKLVVYGWDYDDLFAPELPGRTMNDPIIYSSVDPLDALIRDHPPLYARLKHVGRELLAGPLSLDRIEAALFDAQRLRDSLDSGLPPEIQQQAQQTRAQLVVKAVQTLRKRYGELSALVGS